MIKIVVSLLRESGPCTITKIKKKIPLEGIMTTFRILCTKIDQKISKPLVAS